MRTVSTAAVIVTLGAAAHAQAAPSGPAAGAVIGNQAVATYTNATGDSITVTSNTVETVVQQVAGVTLTSPNSEKVAPGGKAFLPHIITNVGNGADAYDLTATDPAGNLETTALVFYPDANMDGIADSATQITATPTLAPGEQFGVVIEATVGAGATGSDNITVQAISKLNTAILDQNIDTLEISDEAIVELVKSMVVDAGANGIVDAGDEVTITLTYSSTGLAAADNYTIQDILSSGLIYVDDSARWSDSPETLDQDNAFNEVDEVNGSGDTITFDQTRSANVDTINIALSKVASGRSGRVTFKATIASSANAGVIENTATQKVGTTDLPPSNTASIRVDSQFSVSIADESPDGATRSASDKDAVNDVVVETGQIDPDTGAVVPAYQGSSIRHEFVLTNTSNQSDRLTVAVSNVDYPVGTSFRIVGADGATPVIGAIGPLAIGESTKVTLIATLPTDVPPAAAGGSNYTATMTATSEGSGVSDTSTAEFSGAVLASGADLENQLTNFEGDGANPLNSDDAPWIVGGVDANQDGRPDNGGTAPAEPVSFPMLVQNNGGRSDSYNLSLAQSLPAGWTVEFRDDQGTLISNTGTIPRAGTAEITVIVTPAQTAAAGDTLVDIKIESAVSGQSDRIVNAVRISEIHDVRILSDQTAQAAAGGIVDILHTITNEGNANITEGAILQSGLETFSGAIFWDENGDGVLDADEPVIDNFNDIGGLAAGESISVIYRVQTPSTGTSGNSEIATLSLGTALNSGTATDSNTEDNAVEDRITVVSGDITLNKYQYIDATCDDNGGAGGSFSKARQDVEPGQCIRYLIEAENTGAFAATDVSISDAAPAYTTIIDCDEACEAVAVPETSTMTFPAGAIKSEHGALQPGATASLEFTVQVDD